jgi:hypothetical protein
VEIGKFFLLKSETLPNHSQYNKPEGFAAGWQSRGFHYSGPLGAGQTFVL